MKVRLFIPVLLGLLAGGVQVADAFCGFYVAGADDSLYNNATQVVLMRDGTTTVLSMQNNYAGPPSDFAMVVPVPVVLQKEDVKVLDNEVFKRVDTLAAPRLVEYWEQDPCQPPRPTVKSSFGGGKRLRSPAPTSALRKDLGVTVEAQFKVGEYEVVVLSAKFSTGLEEWLLKENYKIPKGAEAYLRPYVQSGSKFFVAKVDSSKVTFKDGNAMLSPLRFHYQSEKFELPVRLGLMNSSGKQDLIVHILSKGKRYEVANYPNVTIPTNLDLNEDMRAHFGEFYAALFDSTIEKNPGAVVTEYSWSSASCDPCPSPPLQWADIVTLGYDVITPSTVRTPPRVPPKSRQPIRRPPPRRRFMGSPNGFILTRLHARYSKDDLGQDLVFQEAPAISGGRERHSNGQLETTSHKAGVNNFQARYAIRHEWKGEITCEKPQRGIWGGPPAGETKPGTKPALDLAFAARGTVNLAQAVPGGIPELQIAKSAASEAPKPPPAVTKPAVEDKKDPKPAKNDAEKPSEKKGCSTSGSGATGLWTLLLALVFWRRRTGGEATE